MNLLAYFPGLWVNCGSTDFLKYMFRFENTTNKSLSNKRWKIENVIPQKCSKKHLEFCLFKTKNLVSDIGIGSNNSFFF